MRVFMLAAAFLISMIATSFAGDAILEKGGKKYLLSCTNAGCFLSEKTSFFSSGPRKRLGNGGSANFNSWVQKLKKQGYK
jgi:hypothetical protein